MHAEMRIEQQCQQLWPGAWVARDRHELVRTEILMPFLGSCRRPVFGMLGEMNQLIVVGGKIADESVRSLAPIAQTHVKLDPGKAGLGCHLRFELRPTLVDRRRAKKIKA